MLNNPNWKSLADRVRPGPMHDVAYHALGVAERFAERDRGDRSRSESVRY